MHLRGMTTLNALDELPLRMLLRVLLLLAVVLLLSLLVPALRGPTATMLVCHALLHAESASASITEQRFVFLHDPALAPWPGPATLMRCTRALPLLPLSC